MENILKKLDKSDWKLVQTPNILESVLPNEKIVGVNNLLNIAWLSRGLELSKAVARVIVNDGVGTGFLIGPDLLLTNNHVISSPAAAEGAIVQFNYQRDWHGNEEPIQHFRLDKNYFKTNPDLDYTIVRIEQSPGLMFGYINLKQRSTVSVDNYVSIIQHPKGGYKQIALTDNKVTAVFNNQVQYITDTEPGSSGSPVFDQQWRITALHHAGGMLITDGGGRVFTNEGISINKIVQDAKTFLGYTDEVYDLVFGEARSEIVNLIKLNSINKERLNHIASHFVYRHPALGNALNEPAYEVAPLIAAAAGVAAGAAIRHWARSSGHESIAEAGEINESILPLIINSDLTTTVLKVLSQNKENLPSEVYEQLYKELRSDSKSNLSTLVEGFGSRSNEPSNEALPVLAGCFIAGVLAGSKAYDGAK